RAEAMRNYAQQGLNFSHCRALPFWGYIDAKGDFYTCSVFLNDPRFHAGNIHQHPLQEIFSNDARKASIRFAEQQLDIKAECRINCRMARINEFLETVAHPPEHVNFI
ncbi:SPASM domain-containing protein, partial [Magnetococcales bacterium HHB-1]